MTNDPNGWPGEARKKALLAAATRMRDACQWGGPPEDWLHDAERILNHDFGDLIAARVAEARDQGRIEGATLGAAELAETRNKALEEAAGVAREYAAISRSTDGPSGPEPEAGAADAIERAIHTLKDNQVKPWLSADAQAEFKTLPEINGPKDYTQEIKD